MFTARPNRKRVFGPARGRDRLASNPMRVEDEAEQMEAYIESRRPPPPAAPVLESAGGRDIRVSWVNPVGEAAFREVSILMRPCGAERHQASSSEWWRVDGRTKTLMLAEDAKCLPPSPCEVTVTGLEVDMPYEAMLEAQTVRGFHVESPVSQSLQVGKASCPAAPLLEEAATGAVRVRWVLPAAAPPVERVLIFMRQVDDPEWGLVDNLTMTLVDANYTGTMQACPPDPTEVVVSGLDAERPYEAKFACLNDFGWSEQSPPSASLQLTKPPQDDDAAKSSRKWFFQV